MKDKESKSLIKSARKTARMAIQLRIVSELQLIAKEFGQNSEDLVHEIEKGAKKLAKKISEQLKITAPAGKIAPKANKTVEAAAKPTSAASSKKAAAPLNKTGAAAPKIAIKAVQAKPKEKTEPVKARTKLPAKKV